MSLNKLWIFVFGVSLLTGCASGLKNFVTTEGDRLMDGEQELQFISYNIPNLHSIEDNFSITNIDFWRLPNEYEIRDALKSIDQMGMNVVRLYALTTSMEHDKPDYPRYVLGPNQFNEDAFKALDKILQVANEYKIRVIIPFIDNWNWVGGTADYARFRGKEPDAFWADPQLKADFKSTIEYVINRRNTYTGKLYKDDKAILAWETGNELESPNEWVAEMAAYIKSIDPNHLVIAGLHARELRPETVADPNVDLLTTHNYQSAADLIQSMQKSAALAKGKKPYFIGEFGFRPPREIAQIVDAVLAEDIAGALIWSLRFHNRDGGFYWHGEWTGNTAYHWPGFSSSDFQGEKQVMDFLRQKNAAIQNKPVKPIEKLDAPNMLPFDSPAEINWQGSAGASSYTIERAEQPGGPWLPIATRVSDADVAYRPLYADHSITPNQNYFYRVSARNAAGESDFSKPVGPVKSETHFIIDELADLRHVHAVEGNTHKTARFSDKARGDVNRLIGEPDASVTYRVAGAILTINIFTFFEKETTDFEFYTSENGRDFSKIEVEKTDHYQKRPNYTDYRPIQYQAQKLPEGAQYLKIAYKSKSELARVEIFYNALTL